MHVISITLKALRHSEYIRYMKDYLYVFEKNDPDVLGVEAQFDALTGKIDDIEDVYKLDRASELTEIIANLDAERDATLVSIGYLIRAYLGHYDESKVQDAKRLNTRLLVYGTPNDIAKETLQGQSATLDNLIYDFQNDPALQASVTSLGLDNWIGQLKITNDNLVSAYADRSEEKGATPSDRIKDLRNEGNDLYYALRDYLLANALLAGYAAPYDTVIQETNAITEQYNQTLARRAGGSPDDEEEEEEEVRMFPAGHDEGGGTAIRDRNIASDNRLIDAKVSPQALSLCKN